MSKLIDLIGRRFGRLVIIRQAGKNKWGHLLWMCECNCGNKTIVLGKLLRSFHTQSCGCLQRERASICNTKHGHNKRGKMFKIYIVWQSMIQRCTNPNDPGYSHYGGRGIKVCKRWINSFTNFLEDMGEVPSGLQIDRIDNNSDYCKRNCRWVTKKQQMRNIRRNHLETHNGKTKCLAEWAEEYNINYNTLCSRLYLYNWLIGKALMTPVAKRKKRSK